MSDFGVSPSNLKKQVSDFAPMQILIESDKNTIDSIASGLAFSSASANVVRRRLRDVSSRLDEAGKEMRSMKRALGSIAFTYSKTETQIVDQTVLPGIKAYGSTFNADAHAEAGVEGGKASAAAGVSASVAAGGFTAASKQGTVSGEGSVLSAEAEAQANAYMNENEIGANASAKASASAAEGELSVNSKYTAGSIAGSLMSAEASAALAASLGYKDGNFYGELSAKAEVGASVAHGEAEGKLGTDYLNAYGKAEGNLVGADASAKAGITVNENGSVELEAKAEAEAYLAKGEVSGGFDLFGIKIGGKVEGMVGVQAEAGGKVTSSSVDLDLGLGPIGGSISIDWTDFNPPKFDEIFAWLY